MIFLEVGFLKNQEKETYVVVISLTPLKCGYYKVELTEADGMINELTVHEEAVVDYRLVVGKELDKEIFEQLQESNEYQKAYAYAINVLSRRLYSEYELKRKLLMREVATEVIDAVIKKLVSIELLNDVTFASIYMEAEIRMQKKSRSQIIFDLRKKGISEQIIEDLMETFSFENEQKILKQELKKAYERYSQKKLTKFELQNKVTTALGRKGFNFDEIRRQYGFFVEDLQFEND